jgi:hypothetical protein
MMKKPRENIKFGIAGIGKNHRALITISSQVCEALLTWLETTVIQLQR